MHINFLNVNAFVVLKTCFGCKLSTKKFISINDSTVLANRNKKANNELIIYYKDNL